MNLFFKINNKWYNITIEHFLRFSCVYFVAMLSASSLGGHGAYDGVLIPKESKRTILQISNPTSLKIFPNKQVNNSFLYNSRFFSKPRRGFLRGCWNRENQRFFVSEFPFQRRGCEMVPKKEPEVIRKIPHLVRPWFWKDSSVQVFPPFFVFLFVFLGNALLWLLCVGSSLLRSFLFSPPARGGNINCCKHHYCGGAEMEKNEEEALDLLLSLQSEDDDAASNDVRDDEGPRGHHSSSPPPPPPPCDDPTGMLSPVTPCGSSWSFFLSFFLTHSFSVFLLLHHILGNSIAAFGRLLTCSRALSVWFFFGIIFVAYISCAILLLLSEDCLLVPRALSFWFFFGSINVAYILCAIDSIAFGSFFWQNFFVFFFFGLVWRFYCILRMVTRRDYSRSCQKLMTMTLKSIISEHLCYFFDLESSMKWASLLQQCYILIAKEFKRDFVMNCTVNNNAVCVCIIVKNERRLKEFGESGWGMLWSSHAIYLPVFGLPFGYGNLQSVERKKLELDSVWMTLAGCKPGSWNKTKPGSSMRRLLLPNHWPRYLNLNLIQVSLFCLSVVPPLLFRMRLVWKWREHHCLVKFVSHTEIKTGAEFCAFIVNKHVQAIFILLHSCLHETVIMVKTWSSMRLIFAGYCSAEEDLSRPKTNVTMAAFRDFVKDSLKDSNHTAAPASFSCWSEPPRLSSVFKADFDQHSGLRIRWYLICIVMCPLIKQIINGFVSDSLRIAVLFELLSLRVYPWQYP